MAELTLIELIGPLTGANARIAMACKLETLAQDNVPGLSRRPLDLLLIQSGESPQNVEADVIRDRKCDAQRLKKNRGGTRRACTSATIGRLRGKKARSGVRESSSASCLESA